MFTITRSRVPRARRKDVLLDDGIRGTSWMGVPTEMAADYNTNFKDSTVMFLYVLNTPITAELPFLFFNFPMNVLSEV